VIGVAVGRYRGVEPRSNVSMIIMRPPQHGHGWGGWSVAAALSGARCFWAVCAGFAAAISSRARAMVWALVPSVLTAMLRMPGWPRRRHSPTRCCFKPLAGRLENRMAGPPD
jgi:hypothetical protein